MSLFWLYFHVIWQSIFKLHTSCVQNRLSVSRHLLGAGLRDIESRWSMGKGPLAVHFAADEVKQIIRALFQNTDHRAALSWKLFSRNLFLCRKWNWIQQLYQHIWPFGQLQCDFYSVKSIIGIRWCIFINFCRRRVNSQPSWMALEAARDHPTWRLPVSLLRCQLWTRWTSWCYQNHWSQCCFNGLNRWPHPRGSSHPLCARRSSSS